MEENKDTTTPPEQNSNEDVLAEQQMAQEAGISVSIGALIYSLFMKTGIAKECTPDQWKKFEAEAVKRIYLSMGMPENEIDPRVCSFTALVMGYLESLRLLSNATATIHRLAGDTAEENGETPNGESDDIPGYNPS